MASFRKRAGRWVCEVRKGGVYKSKTFDAKSEAQRWAYETEALLSKSKAIIAGKVLADALERFAREVSVTHKGAKWEQVRLRKMAQYDIANLRLDAIETDDVDFWIAERAKTVKASTINRELNLLSSVFRHAQRWKWCAANPVSGCLRPKNPVARDRRISDAEIESILFCMGYCECDASLSNKQQLGVAFLLALETGMRQGEIWGLCWENVYLDISTVELKNTKNSFDRSVPLSSRAVELLGKLRPKNKGRVFSYMQASAAQAFRLAVKRAGIENLTFHDARHEATTRLARKLDVLDLARMIGHRDLKSLQIYYNATAQEIAARLD